MKPIKPVRTKADYKTSLARIEKLVSLNPKKGTSEYDELDLIGTLVSAHEDIHFPIDSKNTNDSI